MPEPFALDKDFRVNGEITKTWVDDQGGRYIRGVASGVEEDRDGERCSKSCVTGMVAQINKGQVSLNALHQDDWLAEMGTVVKGDIDGETHELWIDSKLPPEGEDPIADKAWRKMTKEGRKLGFSIGGKLRKAFFERDELGKRRKVLDEITLRHVMLTGKPAYQHSFAEAVAKTFDENDGPREGEGWFDEDVEKIVTAAGGGDQDTRAGENSKVGDRKAGSNKKGRAMSTEDKDEDPDPDQAPDDGEDKVRRLACPNCGHEFAAPLDADDDSGLAEPESEDEKKPDAGKSRQESDMSKTLDETLDHLKGLATDEPAEVEKTEEEATVDTPDVLKVIAASHKETDDRLDRLEGELSEAFTTIAKSHAKIHEYFENLPQGRKSVARVITPRGEDVEKSAEDQIRDTDDPVAALKVLNRETYGIQ